MGLDAGALAGLLSLIQYQCVADGLFAALPAKASEQSTQNLND